MGLQREGNFRRQRDSDGDANAVILQEVEAAIESLQGTRFTCADITALASRAIKRRGHSVRATILDRRAALCLAERRRRSSEAAAT